tara:strand:+ start:58 stop:678 length:621 start_codon:yes stop_codon:yes gene_type:complete
MNKLVKVLQKAIKSKHKSNTSKKHEKWFQRLLTSNGFSKKTLEEVGMSKLSVRNRLDKNDNTLFFIPEPLGSQNTPDFLVSDEEGNLFYIELKSSKEEKITWNGGFPKDNFIYLFSTEKHNSQTIFMGSDCWDSEDRDLLLKHAEILKHLTDTFNKTLKGNQTYYTRNMFNDNEKYYSRDGREEYEKKVFDYINSFQTEEKEEEAA